MDSLDLDGVRTPSADAPRCFDYVIGLDSPHDRLVAVEVHDAKASEISVMIEKKRGASVILSSELRSGRRVTRWYWVPSGKTSIAATSPERRRIQQAGIELVGRPLRLTSRRGSG